VRRFSLLVILSGALGVVSPLPVNASHNCESPLILDLDGLGIATTGFDYPVLFDMNNDGEPEPIGWTAWTSDEAFLWLDRNSNRRVDDGSELFGTATPLSSGGTASNGFEALAEFDLPAMGGNADRRITADDDVWNRLRLWVDRNHNGVSERQEIQNLRRWGIVSLDLFYVEVNELDGAANRIMFRGSFTRRVRSPIGGRTFREFEMSDVFFLDIDWEP